jgi:hypothetical protein
MSAQADCPICMDCIDLTKNCVTTECGHSFHASCLMTSVAHTGFGCPYCRTKMAEEPEEDEDSLYSEEEEEEDDQEIFDQNALRGFRFFWNNIYGEEHDENDDAHEQAIEDWNRAEEPDEPDVNVPTTDFVAQKLREQGVTFEQLVHMMCNLDHEEFTQDEQAERFSNELFGKIRVIVSNYTPDEPAIAPEPIVQPISQPVPSPTFDLNAQPKIYSRRVVCLEE